MTERMVDGGTSGERSGHDSRPGDDEQQGTTPVPAPRPAAAAAAPAARAAPGASPGGAAGAGHGCPVRGVGLAVHRRTSRRTAACAVHRLGGARDPGGGRRRPHRVDPHLAEGLWFHQVAYGLPGLREGKIWTLLTGWFFYLTPGQYLSGLIMFALVVGACEMRLDSRAVAIAAVAGEIGGILLASLLVWALSATSWPWAVALTQVRDVGFTTGALTVLAVTTAALRSPWRLRVRAALWFYVTVALFFEGTLSDVAHAIAVGIGFLVGQRLFGVEPGFGPRTRRETRMLAFGGLLAIGLTELVVLLFPRAGPVRLGGRSGRADGGRRHRPGDHRRGGQRAAAGQEVGVVAHRRVRPAERRHRRTCPRPHLLRSAARRCAHRARWRVALDRRDRPARVQPGGVPGPAAPPHQGRGRGDGGRQHGPVPRPAHGCRRLDDVRG